MKQRPPKPQAAKGIAMQRFLFHTLIGILLTTNAWANLATTQGTAFTQGQFGPHTMDAVSIAGNLTSTGADITAGKDLNITAHEITLVTANRLTPPSCHREAALSPLSPRGCQRQPWRSHSRIAPLRRHTPSVT